MDRVAGVPRAEPTGFRYVGELPTTMRGYWYVRDTGQLDNLGRRCYEIAHMQRGDVVVVTERADVGRAARLANALNRLDQNVDAPIFDERTGRPIE